MTTQRVEVDIRAIDNATPTLHQVEEKVRRLSGAQKAFGAELGAGINKVQGFERGLGSLLGVVAGPVGMIASVTALAGTLVILASRFDSSKAASDEWKKSLENVATAMDRVLERAGQLGGQSDKDRNFFQEIGNTARTRKTEVEGRISALQGASGAQAAMELKKFQEELLQLTITIGNADTALEQIAAADTSDTLKAWGEAYKHNQALLDSVEKERVANSKADMDAWSDAYQHNQKLLDKVAEDRKEAEEEVVHSAEKLAKSMAKVEDVALETLLDGITKETEIRVEAAVAAADLIATAVGNVLGNRGIDMGAPLGEGNRALTTDEINARNDILNQQLIATLGVPGVLDAMSGRTQQNILDQGKFTAAILEGFKQVKITNETTVNATIDGNQIVVTLGERIYRFVVDKFTKDTSSGGER